MILLLSKILVVCKKKILRFEFQTSITDASCDEELTQFVYDGIKALKNKVCELAAQNGHFKLDDGFIENVFG